MGKRIFVLHRHASASDPHAKRLGADYEHGHEHTYGHCSGNCEAHTDPFSYPDRAGDRVRDRYPAPQIVTDADPVVR